MENTAYLSNQGEYTAFDFSDISIRFRTSSALERYTKVIEWDNGYLVVLTILRFAGIICTLLRIALLSVCTKEMYLKWSELSEKKFYGEKS